MNNLDHESPPRLGSLAAVLAAAALLSACVIQPLPAPRYVAAPRPVPVAVQEDAVVSVYVDPPLVQPAPIAVQWAPPPMLVEVPPPQPFVGAVWTGGYWAWEGRWFWSAGRWSPPPQPDYRWVQPYYEHRGEVVVFVPGFWCAPQVQFVPPPVGISITVAVAAPGVRFGAAPMGPQGVFVPPPPGSRAGILVPAPIGTPPAVVVSAPPVVNVGMRVHGNVDINSHNTTNNITNITNITNVTVEAPAAATANGQAFQNSVPASAHLAAAMAPAGRPAAPRPATAQAIPAYQSGRQPMALPAAQPVRPMPVSAGPRPAAAAVPSRQGEMQPSQGQPQPGMRSPDDRNRIESEAPLRQPGQVNGQPQPGQPATPVHVQNGGQQQSAIPQAANPGGTSKGHPGTQPAAQPASQPPKPNSRPVNAKPEKKPAHEKSRDKREEGERER